MKTVRVLIVVLLVAAAFVAGLGYAHWHGQASPGEERVQRSAAPPTRYHCPMHPNYVTDGPGTCPICGMKLVPIRAAAPAPTPSAGAAGTSGGPAPSGSIRISPEKQQLIGVTYGTVERTSGARTIATVGSVALDETRVVKVHPRVDGWVDRVHVDFVGRQVQRGQALLTLYSPDVLSAQQEFLLALRAADASAADPVIRAQDDALVAAARKRLELWDLSASQIDQVARTGTPLTTVTLTSPASGQVLSRNVYAKQRVTTDTELYTIADLRRVWVMAEVFERDAPFIRPGLPAHITVSYTGRRIAARVVLLEPQLQAETRTLRARLDVPNGDLSLKPDMFVDVQFEIPGPERLTVPVAAVLDTGMRKTVFVDRGNGFLEPREVETGDVTGDRVEVLRGLAAGDRIVTSGNFLIDSESQLKAATGAGGAGTQPAAKPSASPHDGHAPGVKPDAPSHDGGARVDPLPHGGPHD